MALDNLELRKYEFYNYHNQFSWYDGNELVATVRVESECGCKWICGVYVSPTYRRKGLGKELLNFARILGGDKLSVSKNNQPAISLYRKNGFIIFDENGDSFYMRRADDG